MSYEQAFYLVRHGNYGMEGGLNTMGREVHAPAAREELLARGLGANTVLLSSDARRAAETAEIISEGLGTEVVLSNLINTAGNRAWNVRDLDAVVEQALHEAGVSIDAATQDLVVVTHAPMLAVARGVESDQVRYGEVLTYHRGTWHNPDAPK